MIPKINLTQVYQSSSPDNKKIKDEATKLLALQTAWLHIGINHLTQSLQNTQITSIDSLSDKQIKNFQKIFKEYIATRKKEVTALLNQIQAKAKKSLGDPSDPPPALPPNINPNLPVPPTEANILAKLEEILKYLEAVEGGDPALIIEVLGVLKAYEGAVNPNSAAGKEIAKILNGIVGPGGQTLQDLLNNLSKINVNTIADWFSKSNIGDELNELNQAVVAALFAEYGGNPIEAIMLWFQMEDNIQDISLSGYGALAAYINKLVSKLTGLEDKFKDGTFTAAEAEEWVKTLQDIKNAVDNNPALSGIKTQVDDAVNGIFNTKITQDAHGNPVTLAQEIANGNYSLVADGLNTLANSPTGSQPVLDNIKQLNTSFTDQSTIVNTQIQQVTSQTNTILNSWNKTVNEQGFMGMISAFVKNQQST